MPNDDMRSFNKKEQDIKDNMGLATRFVFDKMKDAVEELRTSESVRQDSLANLQDVPSLQNEPVFNPFAQNNENSTDLSQGSFENAKVRTIGTNPFVHSVNIPRSEEVTTETHNYNGPSAFEESSSGLDVMWKSGYSGTFILLACAILAVLVFLVSFMIFTYLGIK